MWSETCTLFGWQVREIKRSSCAFSRNSGLYVQLLICESLIFIFTIQPGLILEAKYKPCQRFVELDTTRTMSGKEKEGPEESGVCVWNGQIRGMVLEP